MLYDSDFLRELDEQREKTVYARIISLDLEESPLQQIEGQITSGSVNVDGNSAVRRTCSLSMVAKDINIDDVYNKNNFGNNQNFSNSIIFWFFSLYSSDIFSFSVFSIL